MATPRPEVLACLAGAIGPLDDVYVDAKALDGFAAYRGDLDVFFVVPAAPAP